MPVPADTLALIDLNINSHHCSRIIERIDKKFELTNSYERYGAAIMIISQHFLRSDARLPPVLTKLRTVFVIINCQNKSLYYKPYSIENSEKPNRKFIFLSRLQIHINVSHHGESS